MSSTNNPTGFPDVQAKLQKANKQSAFEKQKAEAEAKRQREEAETAAVYKDFIKSFDRDDDDPHQDPRHNRLQSGRNAGQGPASRSGYGGTLAAGGPSKRHFGATGLKTGPGSLGPSHSSIAKKRSFNDFSRGSRDKPHSEIDASTGPYSIPKAFETSDDEEMAGAGGRVEEKAVAKPTLRLSNLPLGTSPSVIRALMPKGLAVDDVRLQPLSSYDSSERRSLVAVVTLSQETPANDIDAAVSLLQNRYLGYGHYLSLHRHLSSAVSLSTSQPHAALAIGESQPFGAKPVESAPESAKQRQQGFHRGFAPPTSYDSAGNDVNRSRLLHVPVQRPKDIQMIRLVNMVIEGVLENGAEFEALLMSRPQVQREEKWAWIWDARSEGGTWYRWNLWEIITGGNGGSLKGKFVPVFDGTHAWKAPEKRLPFEHSMEIDELASDPDYNSSDDEDFEREANRENAADDSEEGFLNPLEKAKLSHLLARLPTSLTRVRNGDIARVTAFAVLHASRGVEEVVDMVVSNIEKPLALTSANPDRKQDTRLGVQGSSTDENPSTDTNDPSGACLITLYVVNDILSSSATSGVRHAWRFRQLFETALREHKTFEHLGTMTERLRWGRMRAEKWHRSVLLVLKLWEGWCVFPAESQERFVQAFENPPALLKEDNKAADPSRKGKWKVVEASRDEDVEIPGDEGIKPSPSLDALKKETKDADLEVVGVSVDGGDGDIVGKPIDDDGDDDVEGEPIEDDDDDDVEGEPIEDDDMDLDSTAAEIREATVTDKYGPDQSGQVQSIKEAGKESLKMSMSGSGGNNVPARKPRMRAADMFANSDDSGSDKER